jgi:S1-C subfamily serine protease
VRRLDFRSLGFTMIAAAGVASCAGARDVRSAAEPTGLYVKAFRQLHPSVVLFTMKIPSDDPKRKGEWDEAYGSGVVVESGSWGSRILTDAHVIVDAKDLVATTGEAEDLAIVDVPLKNQKAAKLGSIEHLEPGTAIGVLGYPIPDAFQDERLGTTVSLYTGHVASIRKGALEIDVAIIPGESGGPVFDAATGDVIGIAESRFEEERAIGFATPIDFATRFLAAHPRTQAARR